MPSGVGSTAVPANIALGAFLILVALLVVARLRILGRGWLAAYLALVGANYALDATIRYFDVGEHIRLAFATTLLDPAALLLFALSLRGGPPARWVQVAVGLPCVFLAAYALATYPRAYAGIADLSAVAALVMVPYYLIALGLMVSAHHASRSTNEQDLRAHLVVAFGVVVISRLPLVATDVGVAAVSPGARHLPPSILWLDLPLLLLAGATAALVVATAPSAARASARRIVVTAASLILLIEAVWLLRFVPLAGTASYAFLYSIRWVVFAGLVVLDLRRFELLGVPARVGSSVRIGFAAVLGLFIFLAATAIFAQAFGQMGTALVAAALATLPLGIASGIVLYRSRWDNASAGRRLRIYRAHAELRAGPEDLERLRRELGLTLAEANEEERLVALEAAAPPRGLDRPAIGQVFARRYEVVNILGAGSYGLVYDAFDRVEGRRVVLKELRANWRRSPHAVGQLQQEAQAMLRVNDPHLVRLWSVERAADGLVLVMEHVEGRTLRERLAEGPLTEREVAKLAADLLQALATLHRAGTLHRDVKPDNIILKPRGDAVLIDLGAASDADGSGTRPAGHAHVGTPAYMSPEARSGARLTPASDLYAVGIVLNEAFGGAPPARWRPAIERATAKDVADRYPDAGSFRAELPS